MRLRDYVSELKKLISEETDNLILRLGLDTPNSLRESSVLDDNFGYYVDYIKYEESIVGDYSKAVDSLKDEMSFNLFNRFIVFKTIEENNFIDFKIKDVIGNDSRFNIAYIFSVTDDQIPQSKTSHLYYIPDTEPLNRMLELLDRVVTKK